MLKAFRRRGINCGPNVGTYALEKVKTFWEKEKMLFNTFFSLIKSILLVSLEAVILCE